MCLSGILDYDRRMVQHPFQIFEMNKISKKMNGENRLVDRDKAGSTDAAVNNSVSESTSAITGRAPTWATASAVAANVISGTMTSSPGPTPSARSDKDKASVPELHPATCERPWSASNSVPESGYLLAANKGTGTHNSIPGVI